MSDLRTVPVALLRQALESLENGKRVRAGEGGTKYQPPLEDSAIAVLRAALEQPSPVFQDHSIPLGRRTQEQPIQPTAWLTDRQTMYFDKEDARRDCDGFVLPLYTHPPRREPEPQPEPIHPDKIRAEFREMDRCCLPGDMLDDDWFEAGVRWAEAQHEIV